MENVNEGLARQNIKFQQLYRELLQILKTELREKQKYAGEDHNVVSRTSLKQQN